MPANPFSQPSTLPYQAPPFDIITDEHYRPAMIEAIAQKRREVQAIADNPEEPSFTNTFEALEKCGTLLRRVENVFGAMTSANTNPTLQALDEEMSPMLAALDDDIHLNSALFRRLDAVYQKRDTSGLSAEALRLIEVTWQTFQLAGASLTEEAKTELKALNQQAATLSTQFTNRLLAGTKAGGLSVSDPALLAGLTDAGLTVAAQAAAERGLEGQWLLALQNTTQQPVLQELTNRQTREALFSHAWQRCEKGDENDTRELVTQLATIRAQQAK